MVWSSASSGTTRSVQMRRLTNLESPSGPTVGPVVTVDAPSRGTLRADIAFETALDGQKRGVLLWTRKATDTTHEIVTSWFTNLATDTPALSGSTVLLSGTSSSRYGTLLSAPNGVRALVRGNSSAFKVFGHDRAQPLTTWWQGASGTATPSSSSSSPAGVALASGEMLATAETDLTAHVVKVQRFNAGGAPGAVELQLTGYQQPALDERRHARLARDEARERRFDRLAPARRRPAGARSTASRSGAEGGAMSWPNPLAQADSRLRLIVAGPLSSSSRRSVLGFQRLLGTDTAAPTIASAAVSPAGTLAKSVVTYGLTEPARVTFTLQKARRTPRCGKASRRRSAASRRCKVRYGKSRKVTRKGRKGKNRVALSMLGGKRLAAGRYRLLIVATDRAGNSSRARAVTFQLR